MKGKMYTFTHILHIDTHIQHTFAWKCKINTSVTITQEPGNTRSHLGEEPGGWGQGSDRD